MTYDVNRLGIVGAGLMGTGIAEAATLAGMPTVLVKATPGDVTGISARVRSSIGRAVERGKVPAETAEKALAILTVTADRDALADTDLVVESIVEDLADKRALFADLETRVKDSGVFASNTSTLRIADLADGGRERRTIGLHFFSPVPAMKLVEVAHLHRTDAEVLNGAIRLVERLGKTPIPVLDSSGFIVNRLLVPFLLNTISAYGQGLAPADRIDEAMKLGCGHPVGPLALSDLIGLDIVYAMAKLLYRELGDACYRPPALLRRLVQQGNLGKKSGLGFYDHTSRPAIPNPALWSFIRDGEGIAHRAA